MDRTEPSPQESKGTQRVRAPDLLLAVMGIACNWFYGYERLSRTYPFVSVPVLRETAIIAVLCALLGLLVGRGKLRTGLQFYFLAAFGSAGFIYI
jgi:hypothetical protein